MSDLEPRQRTQNSLRKNNCQFRRLKVTLRVLLEDVLALVFESHFQVPIDDLVCAVIDQRFRVCCGQARAGSLAEAV